MIRYSLSTLYVSVSGNIGRDLHGHTHTFLLLGMLLLFQSCPFSSAQSHYHPRQSLLIFHHSRRTTATKEPTPIPSRQRGITSTGSIIPHQFPQELSR